jgi:D-hexose-6-phosphate mutarotase
MPDKLVAALREEFEIENVVGFDLGVNRMPRIVVTIPPAECHIYLHGAHVTHYRRRGQAPLLFLSEKSYFQSDKPIRGGVPICWPWFGPSKADPSYPMHGFARLSQWSVNSVRPLAGGEIELVLSLGPNDLSAKYWPNHFKLDYTITVGESLDLRLTTTNTGNKPFSYEEALHTYFAISDIRQVQLMGLGGSQFSSKVPPVGVHKQNPDPLLFSAETDSVYADTTAQCTIVDQGEDRSVLISKEGSDSTVVWNPWTEKAKAMADFSDEEWLKMLCIETANVWHNAITLNPGQSHTLRQHIQSDRLAAL